MESKKEIYYFLFLIIFAYFFEKINCDNAKSYQIYLNFPKDGLQSLYCDDNIQFFGTNNVNFYVEEIFDQLF